MRRINICIAIALCLSGLGCASLKTGTAGILSPQELQPFGRTILNGTQNLELIGSAAHFGFSFEGDECRIFASRPAAASHGYLQYEMDGKYQKRIRVSGHSADPIVIKASGKGKHTVWVYKATEAHTGPVYIEKVTGNHLVPLQRPAAPLIEFIGNSITCGAAADASEIPCGAGVYQDQHNALQAYGPQVARALGANFMLSSVSGIGIYRNWNNDGPTMPQVYEKADLLFNSTRTWDFTRYKPMVVSIALGTNDFSNGDGKKTRLPFDSAGFVRSYIGFVQLVKSKYPSARIALLSSPMIGGAARLKLQHCLTAVKENIDTLFPTDNPVALYFFEPMKPNGCSGHPSVEDHAVLAKELEPFFRKLLQ